MKGNLTYLLFVFMSLTSHSSAHEQRVMYESKWSVKIWMYCPVLYKLYFFSQIFYSLWSPTFQMHHCDVCLELYFCVPLNTIQDKGTEKKPRVILFSLFMLNCLPQVFLFQFWLCGVTYSHISPLHLIWCHFWQVLYIDSQHCLLKGLLTGLSALQHHGITSS